MSLVHFRSNQNLFAQAKNHGCTQVHFPYTKIFRLSQKSWVHTSSFSLTLKFSVQAKMFFWVHDGIFSLTLNFLAQASEKITENYIFF